MRNELFVPQFLTVTKRKNRFPAPGPNCFPPNANSLNASYCTYCTACSRSYCTMMIPLLYIAPAPDSEFGFCIRNSTKFHNQPVPLGVKNTYLPSQGRQGAHGVYFINDYNNTESRTTISSQTFYHICLPQYIHHDRQTIIFANEPFSFFVSPITALYSRWRRPISRRGQAGEGK